jgi:hypothetical protein
VTGFFSQGAESLNAMKARSFLICWIFLEGLTKHFGIKIKFNFWYNLKDWQVLNATTHRKMKPLWRPASWKEKFSRPFSYTAASGFFLPTDLLKTNIFHIVVIWLGYRVVF